MRCGMYGGTPDKNIHHGVYVGDNVVEGDRFDVTRPEVRAQLIGLDEHQCEVTCDGETTVGILQPLEPDAYQACLKQLPRLEISRMSEVVRDAASTLSEQLREFIRGASAGGTGYRGRKPGAADRRKRA